MARRSNLGLALLTLVAVAVAVYLVQTHRPARELERAPLYPGLAARANDITRIEIQDARSHTELRREGEGWVIANRGNHPALFEPVKALVVAASTLRVLEGKTRNPELYARLGVAPLDAPGSRARRVRMSTADGQILADFLAGETREAREGGLTTLRGLYVRREGEDQAFLVEGEIGASAAPADWIERMLIDIPGERVQRIELGEGLAATRERPADADFRLGPIPEGRRLRSQAMVNSLATALTEFRIDDVDAALARPLAGESLRTTRLVTFDGLAVTVHTARHEDGTWARFEFSHEAPALVAAATTPAAAPAEAAGAGAEPSPATAPDTAAEAAALTARSSGWVYRLPGFKADMLRRGLEELTSEATATPPAATAPAPAPAPAPAAR
jgi:hypothetical protein